MKTKTVKSVVSMLLGAVLLLSPISIYAATDTLEPAPAPVCNVDNWYRCQKDIYNFAPHIYANINGNYVTTPTITLTPIPYSFFGIEILDMHGIKNITIIVDDTVYVKDPQSTYGEYTIKWTIIPIPVTKLYFSNLTTHTVTVRVTNALGNTSTVTYIVDIVNTAKVSRFIHIR